MGYEAKALIAKTLDNAKIAYEMKRTAGIKKSDRHRGIAMPDSRIEPKEIEQKMPEEKDLKESESLKKFVKEIIFDKYREGTLNQLENIWIDGKYYRVVQGNTKEGVLVECKDTWDIDQNYLTEFRSIDEDKIEKLDRDVIDFRNSD